jgi:hypothetical protein
MLGGGIAAGAYALLAALVIGGVVWGVSALRGAGRAAQLAQDATRSTEVTHAMLNAETAAPRDPRTLDSTLRDGCF